ncbi:MAG: hypothetical protein K2J85_06690 [Anaeroplasmataceae bacterium]|nr:hypothetical protein [Anaeroplasmataceae bacterium]
MKKIKIILCFIVMIFGLNYLSSCISEKTPPEEFKPEVSFLLQSIDSSSINFNIQVTEPKNVTIEEIYISLYDGSNKEVELTSNDGIYKVGLTKEITFDSLESSHSYKIDFSFDYFLGEEKKENIVIYSYDFVTSKKKMEVSGTISNWKLDTSLVTFDATIKDEDNIVTDLKICLYSGAELVAKLDTTDGLKIGTNLACTFDTLLPMKEYSVILFATFTFDGQQYIDYKLDGKSFKTIDFSYLPTVEISNLLLAKDIVTFDLTVLDEFKVLTSLSINILDSNDTFLVDLILKGGIESGEHTIEFNLLEPKKEYKIKVLANYSYG